MTEKYSANINPLRIKSLQCSLSRQLCFLELISPLRHPRPTIRALSQPFSTTRATLLRLNDTCSTKRRRISVDGTALIVIEVRGKAIPRAPRRKERNDGLLLLLERRRNNARQAYKAQDDSGAFSYIGRKLRCSEETNASLGDWFHDDSLRGSRLHRV